MVETSTASATVEELVRDLGFLLRLPRFSPQPQPLQLLGRPRGLSKKMLVLVVWQSAKRQYSVLYDVDVSLSPSCPLAFRGIKNHSSSLDPSMVASVSSRTSSSARTLQPDRDARGSGIGPRREGFSSRRRDRSPVRRPRESGTWQTTSYYRFLYATMCVYGDLCNEGIITRPCCHVCMNQHEERMKHKEIDVGSRQQYRVFARLPWWVGSGTEN